MEGREGLKKDDTQTQHQYGQGRQRELGGVRKGRYLPQN